MMWSSLHAPFSSSPRPQSSAFRSARTGRRGEGRRERGAACGGGAHAGAARTRVDAEVVLHVLGIAEHRHVVLPAGPKVGQHHRLVVVGHTVAHAVGQRVAERGGHRLGEARLDAVEAGRALAAPELVGVLVGRWAVALAPICGRYSNLQYLRLAPLRHAHLTQVLIVLRAVVRLCTGCLSLLSPQSRLVTWKADDTVVLPGAPVRLCTAAPTTAVIAPTLVVLILLRFQAWRGDDRRRRGGSRRRGGGSRQLLLLRGRVKLDQLLCPAEWQWTFRHASPLTVVDAERKSRRHRRRESLLPRQRQRREATRVNTCTCVGRRGRGRGGRQSSDGGWRGICTARRRCCCIFEAHGPTVRERVQAVHMRERPRSSAGSGGVRHRRVNFQTEFDEVSDGVTQ